MKTRRAALARVRRPCRVLTRPTRAIFRLVGHAAWQRNWAMKIVGHRPQRDALLCPARHAASVTYAWVIFPSGARPLPACLAPAPHPRPLANLVAGASHGIKMRAPGPTLGAGGTGQARECAPSEGPRMHANSLLEGICGSPLVAAIADRRSGENPTCCPYARSPAMSGSHPTYEGDLQVRRDENRRSSPSA